MFETEATRIIRNAPALAPVPERQPIGDSFFPSARQVVAEMEEDEALAPVDLVSALWVF
jgi:U3 small nucleolar RNA-associated protein 19